jgi:hypothetical protein
MKNTVVVNIFGAPGAGKSTAAAYVFSKLKMLNIDAELVTEFAKDKVWEQNPTPFQNQMYMFGKQSYRIARCAGKVDVIVTDSPLPLSIHYNHDTRLTENFNLTVMDVFNSYKNICYFLNRVKPYNPNGRNQTAEESDAMSKDIFEMLNKYGIDCTVYRGCLEDYDKIVNEVAKVVTSRVGDE